MQTFVQRLVPIPLSFFLLSSLLPVSPGCDEQTSYLWNVQNEKKCCRKCQPGYFMKSRCQQGADTQCVQCQDGHYNKHYNIKFNCETCTNCNQEHFMYQSLCTRIKNSVCTCKPGYECQDNSCSRCIEQKTASVNSATAKTATVASSSNNTTTTGLTSLRSSGPDCSGRRGQRMGSSSRRLPTSHRCARKGRRRCRKATKRRRCYAQRSLTWTAGVTAP
nr:PREDICTED: tumor necrosis factor receptor superfamily member 14-like isoform X2 [Lepisosteus oculatus]